MLCLAGLGSGEGLRANSATYCLAGIRLDAYHGFGYRLWQLAVSVYVPFTTSVTQAI